MKKIIKLTENDLFVIIKKIINESQLENDIPKNILIGDSQTPFIAKQSNKFKLISNKGGENSLWLGGKNLSWLKTAVSKHEVSNYVKNIAICIGTNGGFNKNDNINGLVEELKKKFPKAKLFVIQGSWGWGGNIDKTEKIVRDYYKKFKENGVTIIEPPIGKNEPHKPLPVYKTIANNLDNSTLN
ncbi:hypothetical protein EBU91_03315 [bacterium]|nr:hypothetical protein [bacterium]